MPPPPKEDATAREGEDPATAITGHSPGFAGVNSGGGGRERSGQGGLGQGGAISSVSPRVGHGGACGHPCGLPLLSTKAHEGPLLPRGVPVTSRYSEKYPNHSGPFWCPNITFQYINLYLSTISRLLVMSVISSGTPNKLRSSNHITHNTNRHRTLTCGSYGFENYVDMTETHLRSITNSGTWMLILAPTYSTKVFTGQTA